MTNLEFYKDEIEKNFKTYDAFWGEMTLPVTLQGFLHNHIKECGEDAKSQLYWLLEEHKEPIKLKQWEKDLLELCSPFEQFGEVYVTNVMKGKGHFKGITDTNMSIKEILENCEVEDR